MRKKFSLKINDRNITKIEVEGSKEIVEAFVNSVLTNSFNIFYESQKVLSELYLEKETEITGQEYIPVEVMPVKKGKKRL